MEDDPKTLEEAIKQLSSLRSYIEVKHQEIRELNKEITRLEARASEQGGEMREALARANDVLRSAHAIAERKGCDVSSWEGFLARIDAALKEQHVLLQSYWVEQSSAALALSAPEPREQGGEMREAYPVANEKESALGWSFAYDFLCKISDATRASGEYVCMEGVEAVIRALLVESAECQHECGESRDTTTYLRETNDRDQEL